MSNDYFKHKAGSYEEINHRVENVENIANSILATTQLEKTMNIMDFGSGTGLLLERVAPYVGKITAVDISTAMNEQLDKKRADLNCDLEILEMDLSKSFLDRKFDGIISSMTLHHVDDIRSMFSRFYAMLRDGGILALADLDLEDGSFHTEDTGVFHFGFDRELLLDIAKEAGFKSAEITSASTVCKPQGDYSVFLLTGHR
ncbi:class I SAM-dependent methyltransferase [Motiliproteus sp. MSK22-1]|uniref:class I SAM-dependent DNA methyltransferase n=1 Tax=Motiliproteus sp. MSK22-1 TaxID=1897630 RepID=UPI0009766397|nr:class I SAM-dependent methyltransferase [Motiliproteus sp. MSK22-1]OMH38192.1 methyltransferase [Motiliproteus sp. MSK22-1]